MAKLSTNSQGDVSSRSQNGQQRVRVDAFTLTTAGSTTRSSDTRASEMFSSSGLSALSRSRQSEQVQAPAPLSSRQTPLVQPSPGSRQTTPGRQSPHVRISSVSIYILIRVSDGAHWVIMGIYWCVSWV